MKTRTGLRPVSVVVVAAAAGGLLAVEASPASAAVSCASPVFKRQFFANTSFSGTPKKTDCDSAVNENYGTGDPAGVTLPKDNFSVRWSVTRDFGSGGPFTFAAEAQDGIRVYVDGVRRIDLWKNVSSTRKKSVNLTIPAGKHSLRVDYAAWTGAANVKLTYTPRTTATVDKVKPLAPAGVTAKLDNATAKAVLTWARNKEMDLAGYRLHRRQDGTSTWTALGTTTGTTMSDLPSTPGRTYFYEVRAYDRAGNVSTGSADQKVVTVAVTAPTGLAAQGLDEGVKLTWNPVPGAVKYSVTRYRNGTLVLGKSATGTTYTDTTAPRSKESSTYWVKAVDGAGRLSEAAVATAVRPVAAPHEVTAKPDADRVDLSWKTHPDTDGSYYSFNVYRSRSLPVNTATEPIRCDITSVKLADGRRQYSCEDGSTSANTTYHYVIKGFDDGDRESVASATASVTTLASDRDTTPPAAVTGLTSEATEYGIVLDWNANSETDLKRYTVYRGEVLRSDDEAVCSGSEWAYLAPGTTHYVDATLPDGDERCYWIDAVDTSYNSSFKWTGTAQVSSVFELDLTPSVSTPEGSPVSLTASADDSGTVELSWNTVQGATGYRVLRWDPAAGQYTSLTGDTPVTGTSYTDTTAASGTTHHYWVTALLADGSETAPGADWAILVPPGA
ncbi:PA14 domain-containing protein [Streptomyces sp. NPDC088747]|uniref:PA14 domain-containing protein n=1 Tax=Streptomyces sp. NPDC088747 TaxID=3365886 RepID=UPI00382C07E5